MSESWKRVHGGDASPALDDLESVDLTLFEGATVTTRRLEAEAAVDLARELLDAVRKLAVDAFDRGEVETPAQWLWQRKIRADQVGL